MLPALIAEVGLAHEGSVWLAHSYIDAVADAGATHVKFQAHSPLESSPDETWRTRPVTLESRADYWQRTAFDYYEWRTLRDHAHSRGLKFGLSFFHDSLVADLAPLCDFVKVPSGAVMYDALTDALEKTGKPAYLSDGLYRGFAGYEPNFVRLICTSKYPCPLSECGLNEIRPGIDGLSDHTGEPLTAALATYAGAVAVEVHVTFDKRTGLPDAKASLTIDELREARRLMGLAETAKHGSRPAPDLESQKRYGYTLRDGMWSKPCV